LGEKASDLSQPRRGRVFTSSQVRTSRSEMPPSEAAVARYRPSGENATGPDGWEKRRNWRPVATSQTRTVRSSLPVAAHRLSGENATLVMRSS